MTPREDRRTGGVNGRGSTPLHAVVIFLGAGLLTGCGAAPSPPREAPVELPGPPVDPSLPPLGEREPHIADALAELELAERALSVSLGPPEAPSATPKAPPTPPLGPRGRETPLEATKKSGAQEEEPAIGCEVACRALASMRRSARYVCELAGPADPRCTNAEARVGGASDRVASAKCVCAPP